jgi:hypothetical protein
MGLAICAPVGRGEEVKWVGVAPGFCLVDGVAIFVRYLMIKKITLEGTTSSHSRGLLYNQLGYHAKYEIQSTAKLRLRCLLPTLQGDVQETTVETSGITKAAASYGKVPERSIFNYPDKE